MVDRERGQRVAALFAEALLQSPESRADFLRRACGDDDVLCRSVLTLLEHDAAGRGPLAGLGSPSGGLPEPVSELPTVGASSTPGPSPGRILGHRYRIIRLLGRGGMGEVWQAYDLKLRVDVALKSLRRDRVPSANAIELLRREVRAAREVVSPNVCRIFDLVELDGQEFVSMEYIDGRTLLELLQEQSPLDLRQASEIAYQFLSGLEAIHAAGLIHRDVKPENIMRTRSGRVVLMDFGLARPETKGDKTIAGTPAYMAPEQTRGETIDARADLFAAGVVLAEMTAPAGVRDHDSRESVQNGVRSDPPALPDTPWRPALERALAADPTARHRSARELIRALEEIALRAESGEDLRPYPGLAAFSEETAAYFFGREVEVEAMWKKLPELHLLGLIGPSGAGKSSFLRAGLIPAMPAGWACLLCHPGDAPLVALAQTLAPELPGDTEVMREMVRFEEPEVAAGLFGRWRRRHAEALLVVDQFEELFTLNPPEVQSRVTEILRRLALDADVHVLLAMRDDFLFHCHEHAALAPLFSELTPLGPPTGGALRRALVQPALLCGHRFEDDTLVDEMVAEVEGERGALPLLAFAVSQLWERRDRAAGLLTRAAYLEIGGVAGALAQHAEATLERIGAPRRPIVRELFRNLVTAQGTRAAREAGELLSVFPAADREAAGEVLGLLVDARLLTSFDLPADTDEEERPARRRRVEIIHESLLSVWPRLVRWQTQDADGAQFRDQLRQAAKLWEERQKPDELLWTGTPFREFQLWHERYPGGLTEIEEAFGRAMVDRAERRRKRRRLVVTSVITALVVVVGVVGGLWRLSVAETRRAESNQLLTLGQAILEKSPTAAVAYALAGLEQRDTPEARHLILEALGHGPLYYGLSVSSLRALQPGASPMVTSAQYDPGGRWLAVIGWRGVSFFFADGGPPFTLEGWRTDGGGLLVTGRFLAEGAHLVEPDSEGIGVLKNPGETGGARVGIRVWTLPDGDPRRAVPREPVVPSREFPISLFADADRLITVGRGPTSCIESWPIGGGDPLELGNLGAVYVAALAVGRKGTVLAYGLGSDVIIRSLAAMSMGEPRVVGTHRGRVRSLSLTEDAEYLASLDDNDEIRIWSTRSSTSGPLRVVQGQAIGRVGLCAGGSLVAAGTPTSRIEVWDLTGPPAAQPLSLAGLSGLLGGAFHPEGGWLAVVAYDGIGGEPVALWPLRGTRPYIFRGGLQPRRVLFTADGNALLASHEGGSLLRWSLRDTSSRGEEVVWSRGDIRDLAIDPRHDFAAVAAIGSPQVELIPLRGGESRGLLNIVRMLEAVAISPDGRLVAAGGGRRPLDAVVRVIDRESGEVRVLDPGDQGLSWDLAFATDGRLLSASQTGVHLWDLTDGKHELLIEGSARRIDLSRDRRLLLAAVGKHTLLYQLDAGTVRELEAHAEPTSAVAIDSSGTVVVTGHGNDVRVSVAPHDEVHLLVGHAATIEDVAISPDGRWIASAAFDGTVRLWPMPEGRPVNTLPRNELIERISSLTNLRVVRDPESETGYGLELDEFPGWANAPRW